MKRENKKTEIQFCIQVDFLGSFFRIQQRAANYRLTLLDEEEREREREREERLSSINTQQERKKNKSDYR